MVSFDNEAAVNQIYSRRELLEDHPYMHNVYIMRDVPRSERRNRRVSNMLNEASQSGRRTHTVDSEATPPNNNNIPIIQNVSNVTDGNTAAQNRATSDSLEDISGERDGLGNGESTEIQPNVNTRDNESPLNNNESAPIILGDEGEPETQQSEDTNRVGEISIAAGPTTGNEAENTIEESNSSGNEGIGGKREGAKY